MHITTTPLQLKARPILGRLRKLKTHHAAANSGELCVSTRVRFDALNAAPVAALWLPVQWHQGMWCYAPRPGVVLARPIPGDFDVSGLRSQPDETPDDWIDVCDLPWPAAAQHAALVLLHGQSRYAGEPLFGASVEKEIAAAAPRALAECWSDALAGLLSVDWTVAICERPDPPVATGMRLPAGPTLNAPQVICLASCAYPPQLFDGSARAEMLTSSAPGLIGLSDQVLARMGQALHEAPGSWALLCGDQVYIDATAGLFDPELIQDGLQFGYQRVARSPGWARLREAAGAHFALFDDHEFRDNWHREPNGQLSDGAKSALYAYRRQQREPYWPLPATAGPSVSDPLYADGTPQGYPIFLTDTRSERTSRQVGGLPQAQLMAAGQREAIENWLLRQRQEAAGCPRFMAGSALVLPRRLATAREPQRAIFEDAWPGYPSSLAWLIDVLYRHRDVKLVLLSGDEHLGIVTRITVAPQGQPDAAHTWLSVHAPACYAPYPVANAQAQDFEPDGAFQVVHQDGSGTARAYRVEVRSEYAPPWPGFVTVQTLQDADGQWSVAPRYVLAHPQGHDVTWAPAPHAWP